jgi:RHS repeat-associated protein
MIMEYQNLLMRHVRTACHVVAVLMVLGFVDTAGAQSAEVVEYYHLDALGSVRAVTNQSGAVVRTHDYRPFGEGENPAPGSDATQFTGKERDAESGMDYFGARYYASRTGRFTTVDPLMGTELALVDPQRWNRYTYVGNRPMRLVDPDGRGWASALFKVGKAVYKGADIATEFYGIYEDAKTVVARDSTPGERAWAGLSLASEIWSPVSIGDAKGLASFALRHSDEAGAVSRIAGFSDSSLMKGFMKHGEDFGLTGNWNPQRSAEFSRAINMHINRSDIQVISGTYRGQKVSHYLDPRTGLNVMLDESGNYLSGWRLGDDQLESVLSSGRLY